MAAVPFIMWCPSGPDVAMWRRMIASRPFGTHPIAATGGAVRRSGELDLAARLEGDRSPITVHRDDRTALALRHPALGDLGLEQASHATLVGGGPPRRVEHVPFELAPDEPARGRTPVRGEGGDEHVAGEGRRVRHRGSGDPPPMGAGRATSSGVGSRGLRKSRRSR